MDLVTSNIFIAFLGLLSLGFLNSVLAGLIGTGGSFVAIAIFQYTFMQLGLSSNDAMLMAVGTSLANMLLVTIWLMRVHNRINNIDWHIVKTWTPIIVLGVLTAWTLNLTSNAFVIKLFYATVVALFGLKMLLVKEGKIILAHLGRWVWYISGFVIGFVSILVGTGGSSFAIPVMNMFGTPIKKAIGTATAIALAIGLVSIGAYVTAPTIDFPFTTGNINWLVFLAVIPGAIYGGSIGVRLQQIVDANKVRKIFGLVLLSVAARFIYLATTAG